MIWLVRKDLLRFFADRQGALMAVLVPVVLAALLGMLFAPREGNSRIGILVADGDGGPAVRRLVEAIDASPSLEVREMKEAEARAKLAAGEASLALILPPGTEAALAPARMFAGVPGTVTLLYDPSDSTEANIAEGLLTQLLMQQVMGGMGDRDGMRKMFVDLEGQLGAQASDELRDFLKATAVVTGDLEPDDGGVVAVDAGGHAFAVFNTTGMYRALADSRGRFEVAIFDR
ncbi:MAG: ABC transporter permease [Myxococcales bacterium]|nr:ABC transporter permease [Myxococcales bacterium]